MFCPKCGAQCADDAVFCGSCGNSLKGDAQKPAAAQPVDGSADHVWRIRAQRHHLGSDC